MIQVHDPSCRNEEPAAAWHPPHTGRFSSQPNSQPETSQTGGLGLGNHGGYLLKGLDHSEFFGIRINCAATGSLY